MCSFPSSALLSWYVAVALLLQAGSAHGFVHGFFARGSQGLKPGSRPHCEPAAFVQKKLFLRGVRCRAPRPAEPEKEGLSWNCLHSNFGLKPSAKKCRLNHLRSHSSSVSFLKFLSRMVRIEPSWEKNPEACQQREPHALSGAGGQVRKQYWCW